LPGVHAIRLPSPELCYPPRMPQLCSLSPSLPTPLSSSLLARPTTEVVCNASLSHRWFQPPHNFVFLCGLTLPPLTSAGPRGGDSMSGAENSDGDTGSPSQHMVFVRRCRHSATGRPRHPRGCSSCFRCPGHDCARCFSCRLGRDLPRTFPGTPGIRVPPAMWAAASPCRIAANFF
jgi:hypothetical protein